MSRAPPEKPLPNKPGQNAPGTASKKPSPMPDIRKWLPPELDWFKFISVHAEEKKALGKDVLGQGKMTEDMYKAVRNFIITTYWQNPGTYLTATACRSAVNTDAMWVYRIHMYLEKAGFINGQTTDPAERPSFNPLPYDEEILPVTRETADIPKLYNAARTAPELLSSMISSSTPHGTGSSLQELPSSVLATVRAQHPEVFNTSVSMSTSMATHSGARKLQIHADASSANVATMMSTSAKSPSTSSGSSNNSNNSAPGSSGVMSSGGPEGMLSPQPNPRLRIAVDANNRGAQSITTPGGTEFKSSVMVGSPSPAVGGQSTPILMSHFPSQTTGTPMSTPGTSYTSTSEQSQQSSLQSQQTPLDPLTSPPTSASSNNSGPPSTTSGVVIPMVSRMSLQSPSTGASGMTSPASQLQSSTASAFSPAPAKRSS